MAETEVESILREIRERVLTEQRSTRANVPAPVVSAGNGARVSVRADSESSAENNLALLNSYLTTTARTWDRLPPLVSNRSGSIARLELWLKRLLKRATHWFTWEQVNFNASVYHALRDLPPIFYSYEQELARLRDQIAQAEVRRTEIEGYQAELTTQIEELQTQLETQRHATETERGQADARLAGVVSEFRERISLLQEERRVSFKQLAIEASEAATLEDRARRKTDALLEDLQRRIDQLEPGK